MGIFSILAAPLGYVMRWLYMLVVNYGWAIVLFTFVVKIVLFPLSMKQQKSTARMSAYQPMIQEIQKKWANDRNRQSQEVQKFYEENNIKMSVGCAPMLINMLVLFGMIAVIQSPLNYILQMPEVETNTGVAIVQHYVPESTIGDADQNYTRQSTLIGYMRENPEWFIEGAEVPVVNDAAYVLTNGQRYEDGKILNEKGDVVVEEATMKQMSMSEEDVRNVEEFKFDFLGLNLADAPTLSKWWTLVMPILSLLTMVGSQVVVMLTGGQPGQGKGQMIMMTIVFGVMFGFFAFRVPAGFSLYYTVSNIVITLQQFVLRKIYDPKKIRQEIEAEIAARKAAKKAKKKVVVKDDKGEAVAMEVTESELIKLRLARARELDAERYGLNEAMSTEQQAAAKKAEELDKEKYGAAAKQEADKADTGSDQ